MLILVQVYNIDSNTWSQATPFPGQPVFGHAGGIVNNMMVVCDGVKITFHLNKKRSYAPQSACFKGMIDEKNPEKIAWYRLKHPTGVGRYRMAASGDTSSNGIIFVGGSDNPYNYNGIGYNKVPSLPDNSIWQFDTVSQQWQVTASPIATMDHRNLLIINNQWITLGGMLDNQQVTNKVIQHNK